MFTGPAVTPNSVISPDGTTNATTLNSSGGTNDFLYQGVGGLTVSTIYTFSFYIKNVNSTASRVWGPAQADAIIGINWSGATLSSVSGAGASFNSVGNGWYRVVVTGAAATTSPNMRIYADTTNSSKSIYIYGTQFELGAYATSYIPTTSAAVTRLADECIKTGISSLIGQAEGTLFAEFEINANNTDAVNRIFSVTDGTLTSRVMMIANTDETFRFIVTIAGTSLVNITTSTSVLGGRHKVAFAYKASDFVAYVDGVQVGSNTAVASVPASLTTAYVGTNEGGGNVGLEGTISQTLLFKTRLTNAQLAELTA
jgi:hypothetical protein